MRRIRWAGVTLGVLTTVILAAMFLAFISLVLEPFVSTLTGTAPVDGVTSTTVVEERVHAILMGMAVISAVLLSFFVGGLVAGRFVTPHAVLNGTVRGIIVVAVPFAWLLGSIVFVLLEPITDPGDVYTRAESLRMLVAALIVYSVLSPTFVGAGFLGGRVGKRLQA